MILVTTPRLSPKDRFRSHRKFSKVSLGIFTATKDTCEESIACNPSPSSLQSKVASSINPVKASSTFFNNAACGNFASNMIEVERRSEAQFLFLVEIKVRHG